MANLEQNDDEENEVITKNERKDTNAKTRRDAERKYIRKTEEITTTKSTGIEKREKVMKERCNAERWG